MRGCEQAGRPIRGAIGGCVGLAAIAIVTLALVAVPSSATALPDAPRAEVAKPPRHWDPRILPFVRFVEHARGLTFKHPVPVHFLSDTAFDKESAAAPGSLTKSDRAGLNATAGALSAVGLAEINGHTLFNDENSVNSAETEAYYDYDKKAVFVRGTNLDLDTRVTIAHELTHALQDQYFDLNRLNDVADDRGNEASDAITALIEGDAVTVENDYVGSLSDSQQNRYFTDQNQEAAAAEGSLSGNAPAILEALSEAPYDVGPTFVQALLDNGGKSRLNRAFTDPPRTDADILNPARYLAQVVPPRLATPRLVAGERRVGTSDSLGAEVLYFMLSARLDPITALQAADAWGADRYVQFDDGGVQCLRDTLVGRNRTDTTVLANALAAWTLRGPRGAATTQSSETRVTVRSCDPGPAAVPADLRIVDASMTLANRAVLVGQALDGGLSPSGAQCTADRLVADPFVVSFLNVAQPTKQQTDEFGTKAQDATAACHA